MPKIERREFRWQKKKVRCNNANQHSGGGSRARKNHIGIIRKDWRPKSIVNSVEHTQCTKRRNKIVV